MKWATIVAGKDPNSEGKETTLPMRNFHIYIVGMILVRGAA